MPEVFGSADVLVAVLTPDAGEFSVPSKVLAYMCAQRPILVSIPVDNLVAKIIAEHNMGFAIPPMENSEFIKAADELIVNPESCKRFGNNARVYAEEKFNIREIGDKFEKLIL